MRDVYGILEPVIWLFRAKLNGGKGVCMILRHCVVNASEWMLWVMKDAACTIFEAKYT